MPIMKYQCLVCFKTYIGESLGGDMICNCQPPKSIKGTVYALSAPIVPPLSDELTQLYSADQAAQLRDKLCSQWGMPNKSHKAHGKNFSSPQTLVNLIHDIVSVLQGGLRNQVRQMIIKQYNYDIDTQMMFK